MIMVAKEDVLKGLKKFKRLAKQDLLVSQLTPDPTFWITQAEGRRATYAQLMDFIECHGLDHAYRYALQQYADRPILFTSNKKDPEMTGKKQALEMFFTLLGVQVPKQKEIRTSNQNLTTDAGNIALNAQS